MRAGLVVSRHQREQVLLGDLVLLEDADIATVAQHGGAVRNSDEFGDPVRNDQHGRAAIAQAAHLGKEPFGGIEVERC
jgi:hypothetical protein